MEAVTIPSQGEIQQAGLKTVNGSAHMLFWEEPAGTCSAIVAFHEFTEVRMKWIRFSGWALILSALIFLFGFAWDHLLNGPFTPFTVMIGLFGNILFLVGLPGIQQSQPQTGRPGQVGLILMGMGAVIAIIANLLIRLARVDLVDWIPLTSAIVGSLGSIIVGWLTIRAHVFRPLIGWLLIIGAILNILFPVLPPEAVFISQIGLFAQSAALIGYGITMLQRDMLVSSGSIPGSSQ